MNDRTDNPNFDKSPDWAAPEITQDFIEQRVEDFYNYADDDSYEGLISLSCAIDALTTHDNDDYPQAAKELMAAISSGRLPMLEKYMSQYLACEVEAGNDDWASNEKA